MESLSHIFAAGTPLRREALRDVNFRVETGERVGIAGHTGSGKSTLVQLLAGLLKPTAGQVLLDGVPAHGHNTTARDRRRRMGMGFQYPEDQIFEGTVFREVAFGPRNAGLKGKELQARVTWALGMVGLDADTVMERVPYTLSGGETRRVALASTIALQPEVLILDEPTAGLDPRGRDELLTQIGDWHTRTDLTLIVVSHDLTVLARTVDRVIVLRGGRVSASGPVRHVLSGTATLRESGLDPLPSVLLLEQVRAGGASVRIDRFLPEEAAAEIARALEAGTRSHVTRRESA